MILFTDISLALHDAHQTLIVETCDSLLGRDHLSFRAIEQTYRAGNLYNRKPARDMFHSNTVSFAWRPEL
jgi:hypothetical protein